MEARMARIESMMEALIQERGISVTTRGSFELETSGNESYHAEAASQAHPDLFGGHLVPVGQQPSEYMEPSSSRSRAMSMLSTAMITDQPGTITFGSQVLQFPAQPVYQKYLDHFFSQLSFYHPCIDEVEFRNLSSDLVNTGQARPAQRDFLALHYAMFAYVDIESDTSAYDLGSIPPGWHWSQLVDELIGKRPGCGAVDTTIVCVLIFQVSRRPIARSNAKS